MPTVIQNRQTSRDNELPSKICELLPSRLIFEIEAHIRKIGRIEEIRLRRDRCASLTVGSKNVMLESLVRGDEMDRILAGVSGNSLYAHSETLKNGYITLTDKGREIAERVYERHQVFTEWLTSIGVPPEIAAEDACHIEHDLSVESFEAIKAYIENHKDEK